MTATQLSGGGGYAPEFRRNENDRRPAKVVWRENDGPGDMAARRARARLARERAEARRIKLDRPKTQREIQDERREAASLKILTMLRDREGGLPQATFYGVGDYPAHLIEGAVKALVALGLAENTRVAAKRGSFSLIEITDAGRDYLDEVAL